MKNNIRYLYTFVLVLCSFAFVSQTLAQGTLSGTVTDRESGEVLIGVNIIIIGEGMGIATDVNGEYEITGIPEGDYEVEARYIGYNTQSSNIRIIDGGTTVLDFELLMSTSQLGELVVTSLGFSRRERH